MGQYKWIDQLRNDEFLFMLYYINFDYQCNTLL